MKWNVLRPARSLALGLPGVLVSGAWLLARADGHWAASGGLWVVSGVCTVLVWRTRLHLLWMLGAGALLGATGLI